MLASKKAFCCGGSVGAWPAVRSVAVRGLGSWLLGEGDRKADEKSTRDRAGFVRRLGSPPFGGVCPLGRDRRFMTCGADRLRAYR
jgi:hypothetical protein